MDPQQYDNAIYEEVENVAQNDENMDIKKNECYEVVKKLKSDTNSPTTKSSVEGHSPKKAVLAVAVTVTVLVVLLGTLLAATAFALYEIFKLKSEMASLDPTVTLQQ